jgi:hypothetical protein
MLCGAITCSRCPHVTQRPKLLGVSLRGRENIAEITHEFESSASPMTWHVCSWCNILQLTWCCWLKQIVHKLLHKNLSFPWTQLWVQWQTYWRYCQIVCCNTNAMSKFQVMNFLYITLLTPRSLKWPQCVHVIHLFRRTCENNIRFFMFFVICCAQNILNF